MSWLEVFIAVVITIILIRIYKKWIEMKTAKSTIYRFYRPSCKFCVESQSEWDKFKQIVNSDLDLKFRVTIIEINLDDAKNDQGLISRFNIPGVPYVVKVTESGKQVVYNNDRIASGYVRFVEYG